MRFCGIYDKTALGRITLTEYAMMMEAACLKYNAKLKEIHLQAWLNHQVTATKKSGKKSVPYYKSFDDFCKIDNEKPKPSEKEQKLMDLIAKANG